MLERKGKGCWRDCVCVVVGSCLLLVGWVGKEVFSHLHSSLHLLGTFHCYPHTAYSFFLLFHNTHAPFFIGTVFIFSSESLHKISSSQDIPISASTCGSATSCSRICSNLISFMKSFTVDLCLCLSLYLSLWCLRVRIIFYVYIYVSAVHHKAKINKELLRRYIYSKC